MVNSYRRSTLERTGTFGTVYLLHFSRPYKGASHYVGFTTRDVQHRIQDHKNGNGLALTKAVRKAGIEMTLVRTWEGVDAVLEYIIKSRAESPKLCPVCNPDAFLFAQYPDFAEVIALELPERIECEAPF